MRRCWYAGGRVLKVCLLRMARTLTPARMESGVSRSTFPSLVWASWAAAESLRCDLLRGLKPGMPAR